MFNISYPSLIRVISVIGIFVLIAGCVASTKNIKPLDQHPRDFGFHEDEKTLFAKSDQFLAEAKKNGLLESDPRMVELVKSLGHELVPTHYRETIEFKFFVIKEPSVNAFAFANGNIYFTTGLLARLENVHQLALILGHEIAHVYKRHSLIGYRTRQNTIAGATIGGIFTLGLSNLVIPSSLASFSRKQETDADIEAKKIMNDSRFSVEKGGAIFDVFARLSELKEIKHSAYSSHPTNVKRKQLFKGVNGVEKPEVDADLLDRFNQLSLAALRKDIELYVSLKDPIMIKDAINVFEDKFPKDSLMGFYELELKRITAEKFCIHGRTWQCDERIKSFDIEQAQLKNHKALFSALNEGYQNQSISPKMKAKSERKIGFLYRRLGDVDQAIVHFKNYLKKHPNAKDVKVIKKLILRMSKKDA